MRPLPIETREDSNKLIASIYQICVFGNGTVHERDKKLVKGKIIPSYIQAKWIRFNKFGLNQTKVENALIMFFAKSTTIVLDLVVLPLAFTAGHAQIQIIPIIIDSAKLILAPIPQLLMQEYFERKFNEEMFSEKDPQFISATKEAEEFMVQKHHVDFTLADGYLECLKKFSALPMLNYIFFYSQMTEEFIIYRKKYSRKDDLHFKKLEDAVEYFTITFRMMRFFYHTEIHALNYFFNNAFHKIMDFYLNVNSLREKFISVFYEKEKEISVLNDTKQLLSLLNFKIQKSRSAYRIHPEISEEACTQFQHFYFSFFYSNRFDYKEVIKFLETPEIKSMLQLSHDDSVRLRDILFQLAGACAQPHVDKFLSSKVTTKTSDFLHLILNTLTSVSSPQRSKQISGSLAIVGISIGIGGLVAAAALGIKNHKKIENLIEKINIQIAPVQSFFIRHEKQISEWFKLDSVVLNSTANRVIGSMLFIAGHIPGLASAGSLIGILKQLSPFNPLKDIIIRYAEDYTKRRLEEMDMTVLHRIDRTLRLAYTEEGELILKILAQDGSWRENFNMNLVQEEYLYFFTHNFARVVRHECQNMGFLFEKIALLDREIESFTKPGPLDILYSERDEKGPLYFAPMCRVTSDISPELVISQSKQRFFDILIERQTLLILLINRSYYITLYNLFMKKMRSHCDFIFKDHLPFAMDMLEHLKNPLDFEMMPLV